MTSTATPTRPVSHPAAPAPVAFKRCSESTSDQCMRIFGEAHPDDVLAPLKAAVETIYWFKSLFKVIEESPETSIHIRNLAGMGHYVAEDIGNITDVALESMANAVTRERDA